jgi:hypothetical protein
MGKHGKQRIFWECMAQHADFRTAVEQDEVVKIGFSWHIGCIYPPRTPYIGYSQRFHEVPKKFPDNLTNRVFRQVSRQIHGVQPLFPSWK